MKLRELLEVIAEDEKIKIILSKIGIEIQDEETREITKEYLGEREVEKLEAYNNWVIISLKKPQKVSVNRKP